MSFKSLLIIILAFGIMFAIGWISFTNSDTEANIRIDTQEIKKDSERAIEKGKEFVKDAQEAINDDLPEDETDRVKDPDSDRNDLHEETVDADTNRRGQ